MKGQSTFRVFYPRAGLIAFFLLLSLSFAVENVAQDDTGAEVPALFASIPPAAVNAYRQGWVEILEYGRWTEAERLYRQSVALAPDFLLAKSVLARITEDATERARLYDEVQGGMSEAHPDALLLLRTYQRTLELFAAREAGTSFGADDRRRMAETAVADYGEFLAKYPGEWSVMIEYIEWVHALNGPAAAIEAVACLQRAHSSPVSFSYFPASFNAELGNFERAEALAMTFAQRQVDHQYPQPAFINALIFYHQGNLEAAQTAVETVLERDPRHLLAERLASKVREAISEAKVDAHTEAKASA